MRAYSLLACLSLALGFVRATPARAQSAVVAKEFHAFHIIGVPPHIDGRLDDEVWQLADSITDFVQMDPDNMAPATEQTMAQVAYDNRYIYVAVHCYYKNPSQVSAGLGRRDNIPNSDRLYIN